MHEALDSISKDKTKTNNNNKNPKNKPKQNKQKNNTGLLLDSVSKTCFQGLTLALSQK